MPLRPILGGRRLVVVLGCVVAATVFAVPTLGASPAAAAHADRVGGSVRSAWPKTGRAPRSPQARWLARQVGATVPRQCARRWRKARRRCHLDGRATSGLRPAVVALNAADGDHGSPSGRVARMVAATPGSPTAVAAAAVSPLKLVRSYQIPADDPAYIDLLNWSWTYDSALAAAAFASTGDKANSAQLLDQLSALQYTDGAIDIAFNTATGQSSPVARTGTVAWLGLAAATYDKAFGSDRYLATEKRSANFLIGQLTSNGLVKGGPGVEWISTQHNLIAYVALVRLADELRTAGDTAGAANYQAIAVKMSAAINANLLVTDASGSHFLEGLGDPARALDVQALGAMYLQGTGQPALAAAVLAYAQRTFAVSQRTVTGSSDPDTFNMTYQAKGPFAGYAPYAGGNAPNVLWAEGSGEMRIATAALGLDTGVLDKAIASWAAITSDGSSLQSDQTVTNAAFGVSYHVWPASSAAAWTILAHAAPAFFVAPLPASATLVTGWTKVRGGNLITVLPDGRVDMVSPGGGGERRVLADPGKLADYTVTANTTLVSGAGYGIYVRASVDAGTKMTAYAVQVDHTYGQLVLREIQNDVELSAPLARTPMPTGFAWYGTPHVVGVTVVGNTMKVTLDGASMMDLPDLAAASAAAVKVAYNVTATYVPPTTGGYGLRAWSDAIVTLQQMTVIPAA